MEDGNFRPVSVREGTRELKGPFEGVPDHLLSSLTDWLRPVFYPRRQEGRGSSHRFQYDLLREVERRLVFSTGIGPTHNDMQAKNKLETHFYSDRRFCLDVVDFVLWKGLESRSNGDLDAILYEAGSVYKVAYTTGSGRLERRVEEHTEVLAKQAMSTGDSASELLSHAWSATYGLEPNPSEGYRCAVRAVEAIAGPLILPSDSHVTLGKIISHLRDARNEWEFALPSRGDGEPSVQTIIDCLGSLWTSQYDRHVREDTPLHVQPHEAEAAVPLAAVTIHWLQRGLLKKG